MNLKRFQKIQNIVTTTFGNVNKVLKVNIENLPKFIESGIYSIQEKRVAFLRLGLERLEKRNNEIEFNLEDYL